MCDFLDFLVSADVQGYVAVGWSRKPVLQAIAHEDIDVYTCKVDYDSVKLHSKLLFRLY